jgi:hypothetical protein
LFGPEALPLAVGADHDEVAVRVLLHCAGRDHLVDELLGHDSVGVRRLHVLHLRLQRVVLGELGLDVQPLSLGFLLLVGDLLLGASPLAARLEQVGGHALVGCRGKKGELSGGRGYLLLTAVEA